ncbi:hypothetical protein PV08_10655 [Exophiala spinifera]|uniref:RTA1 domain protein n=1 Tax=Exophiala spinifera TaxID=91928 RepID=A0A0D2AY53_9EURO|nr:uncharacterized protein PV08_10655 [Exophiala spinifera]KIW11355.1 hypothetical protein PV08_10655 [Exophiala spinifera]
MSTRRENTPACAAYNRALDPGNYGYHPSLAAGVVFSTIFGLIAIGHLVIVMRTRVYWIVLFSIGATIETIGWVGRAIGYHCPYSRSLFLMQTATLIMGPSWTQAGIYIALWVLVRGLGRKTSPFSPTVYLFGCFVADVVCLSLQATGGGLAGSAYSKHESTDPGTKTMVAGIISQLGVAVVFCFLFAVVVHRGATQLRDPGNRKLWHITIAIVTAISMMIMRNVYRSIELLQGWRGYLITHERFVVGLDAVPMTISMATFLVIQPTMGLIKRKVHDQGSRPETTLTESSREKE